MNVDAMRKIDRWVGVPLCFLMSIIIWISTTIRFIRKKKPDLSKVLFIELSEMGSAIIVDPAMRKLQKEGNSELFFAIFEENYKSLEILQTVPEANTFKMRSSGLFVLAIDVIKFMFWCRKRKINTVIDLELFSRFTALLCALSGARSRIGYASHHDEGLYRGNLINYPGDLSTRTADLTTAAKIMINSILSTPGARALCADAKNFYLNTPLD